MIPTKIDVEQNVTDLPNRASSVSHQQLVNVTGGKRDRYRCWLRTYALCGPAHGHDRRLGELSLPTNSSSDARAEAACRRRHEAAARESWGCSYRGIHSQWLGRW